MSDDKRISRWVGDEIVAGSNEEYELLMKWNRGDLVDIIQYLDEQSFKALSAEKERIAKLEGSFEYTNIEKVIEDIAEQYLEGIKKK